MCDSNPCPCGLPRRWHLASINFSETSTFESWHVVPVVRGSCARGAEWAAGGGICQLQYSVEDRAVATFLKPKPRSFLAGKATATLLNSMTPANGDVNPYAIWPVTLTERESSPCEHGLFKIAIQAGASAAQSSEASRFGGYRSMCPGSTSKLTGGSRCQANGKRRSATSWPVSTRTTQTIRRCGLNQLLDRDWTLEEMTKMNPDDLPDQIEILYEGPKRR